MPGIDHSFRKKNNYNSHSVGDQLSVMALTRWEVVNLTFHASFEGHYPCSEMRLKRWKRSQTLEVWKLMLSGGPRMQSASTQGKVPVTKLLGRFQWSIYLLVFLPDKQEDQNNLILRGSPASVFHSRNHWAPEACCCLMGNMTHSGFSLTVTAPQVRLKTNVFQQNCIWNECKVYFLTRYIFNWMLKYAWWNSVSQRHLYLLMTSTGSSDCVCLVPMMAHRDSVRPWKLSGQQGVSQE